MKTLIKEFFRDLWKTRTRFLSLLSIVALGCGFFAGISATGDNMKLTLDTYLKDQNFFDVMVTSNFGITDGDLDAIREVDGVIRVNPAYMYDVLLDIGERRPAVRINSYNSKEFSSDSNKFELVSGRLLENPKECLVEDIRNPASSTLSEYFVLGNTIKMISGNEDQDLFDYIKNDEYTIVGTVASSIYYVATDIIGPTNIGSGSREGYILLPEEEFTMEVYTTAYINVEGSAETSTFSDEYGNNIDNIIDIVESTSNLREPIRFEEIKKEPLEKILEAEEELADGKADGEKEIADGKIKLSDAKIKLEDGKNDYIEGENTYNKEISDAEIKLADAKIEIEKAHKDIEEGRKEYREGEKAYGEAENAMGPIDEQMRLAKAELDFAKAQLDAGRAQITVGYAEIEKKQQELNTAAAQIEGVKAGVSTIELVLSAAPGMSQGDIDNIKAGLDQIPFPGISLSGTVQSYYDKVLAGDPTAAVESAILNGAIGGINNEIATNQGAIDSGQTEINSAKVTLDASDVELKKQEKVYEDGLSKFQKGESELAAGKMRLYESKKELDEAGKKLAEADAKLEDGKKEYEDGLKELEENRVKGQNDLAEARGEIAKGEKELADAEIELSDAEKEFETTIKDGEVKIADAKRELDNLSQAEWDIVGRQNYQAVYDFGQNAERVDSISRIFPAFFFAIAALVCLTSMTRMVEEKRNQTGTLKALGYSQASIIASFLMYAILASVIGSTFGLLIGLKLFPYLIFTAYSAILYRLPTIILPYRIGLMLGTGGVAIFCVVIATLSATLSSLREEPANLLRPVAPKAGKRIFLERIPIIWKRLKFSQKVTMRNLFRYKKRMMMSLVGIAGCTALMVAGFGLRDSISNIATAEFESVMHYDAMVIMDEEKLGESDLLPVKEYLDGSQYLESYFFTGTMGGEVTSQKRQKIDNATIRGINSEDYDEFNKYFGVNDKDGQIELPKDGAIISDKLALLHKKKIGDTIRIKVDQVARDVVIKGIMKNYTWHFVIMETDYLEETFNQRLKNDMALIRYKNKEDLSFEQSFAEEVMKEENVLTVSLNSDLSNILTDQMDSLNMIVLVLIGAAGLLSFIVMYNLTNINIIEREREIATLKVLGYYPRETFSYIFRENIILTIIGTLAGLIGGIFLTRFLVGSAEIDEMVFVKVIKANSYVFAFLLSIVFSVLVQLVMTKRLKNIDMIESLKSVE